MKKKTIVFFPVEPGIAHITRSLAIAEVLKQRGHRVIFAITTKKQAVIKQSGFETVSLPVYLKDDIVYSIEKLKDVKYLLPLISKEQEVLKKINPDCSVIDFRLTAAISCTSLEVPIAFLTGSGGLPYGCYLPNPGYPKLLHSFFLPLINLALWNGKKPFIDAIEETLKTVIKKPYTLDRLLRQLVKIVPEVPDYLPAVNKTLDIKYVGPIFWQGFTKFYPVWITSIAPNGKTVYLSFGGTGLDSKKLIDITNILINNGYRVIVSASNIIKTSIFAKHKNLYVTKFINGDEICKRVDVVICHGGYGTMMQAVLNGKPIVSLPFNPDQLLHALRFQELGLGRCVVRINPLSLLNINWQKFLSIGSSTPTDKILAQLEYVLANKQKFDSSINTFRQQLVKYNGANDAANIIESLC